MPRSDSADSQSQAIQEEPLPSTSNEEEDPLAGKTECFPLHQLNFWDNFKETLTYIVMHCNHRH